MNEEKDPWALVDPKDPGKKWREMTGGERCKFVLVMMVKLIILVGLLYMFICSLDFLSNAFRLLGGKAAGEAFTNNVILSNPIANLMVGILATVLLQSSSTTTSIVVAMVAGNILTLKPAIFIIMGANIGTSVTNTLVAIGQAIDRDEFRRAFGGATIHDMFNWLAVIVLLPIEAIVGTFAECGPICLLTGVIVDSLNLKQLDTKQDFLKVITKPFTELIIQVDSKKLELVATGKDVDTLVKHWCGTAYQELVNKTVTLHHNETSTASLSPVTMVTEVYEDVKVRCVFVFEVVARAKEEGGNGWSDPAVGGVLLAIALVLLCVCLICIVKLLHSMLKGQIAVIIKKVMNTDLPGRCGYLTGYLAMLVGAGLTILVQSSSILTSALTPLVGIGVLSIERMYPLTLGANIGTTFTAILAALASGVDRLPDTLRVALAHLFFNIIGILIWYPIPFLRFPIPLAKALGDTVAKYRWFSVLYLVVMFLLVPGLIFGLSLAGWQALVGVGIPLLLLLIFIGVVNVINKKRQHWLPKQLRNWSCLPRPLRSLQPWDRICGVCTRRCQDDQDTENFNQKVIKTKGGIVVYDQNENSPVEVKVVPNDGIDNTGFIASSDDFTKL